MKDYTFLTFIFIIAIGVLFIGSGITGLYSIDVGQLEYCDDEGDCNYGKVCCGFKEGSEVFRVCANDCKGINSLSQEVNYNDRTVNGFVFDITGSGVQEVKKVSDYWIYILIGVVLILLALFYKKSPKQVVVKKKVIKRRRRRRKKR